MSCLIVLDDGRACAPAAWAYDAILGIIADHLAGNEDERQFAAWLRNQTCEARGVGQGHIDLRELTPENRRLFQEAVWRIAEIFTPSREVLPILPGWRKRLDRLMRMMESIDRGESPDALSDVSAPIAPTGLRRGPGWRVAV